MLYPQMLQEGVLIRFVARRKAYNYHGGGSHAPFLCEGGKPAADIARPPKGQDLR
jgi:hypothetical protein